MSLIISPKTTRKVIKAFSEVFQLEKITGTEARFWHGNFNDSLYQSLDGRTKVLFTGYGGAVVGQAIIEYATQYKHLEEKPEIYFVGSIYAYRDSKLEPGDLVYAQDTLSPDSFEQSIYKNAEARGITNITRPDPSLLEKVLAIAKEKKITLHPAKVYCCITPGFKPDFTQPNQLMNEAMWWKVSLAEIKQGECDSGEYESASALATSRLFGIPAVALLDVKDKRYSETDYRLASSEQKNEALHTLLNLIKRVQA